MPPNFQAGQAKEESRVQPGIFAGGADILSELLKTPRVTKSIRILLSHLDPENARALVRTLMFQDSGLFLDLICSLPKLVNAVVHGNLELCARLVELPKELLDALLPRLLDEMDAEQIGRAVGLGLHSFVGLFGQANPKLAESAQLFSKKASRGLHQALDESVLLETPDQSQVGLVAMLVWLLGRAAAKDGSRVQHGIGSLSTGIRQVLEANPEFVTHVIQPLRKAVNESIAGVQE